MTNVFTTEFSLFFNAYHFYLHLGNENSLRSPHCTVSKFKTRPVKNYTNYPFLFLRLTDKRIKDFY